MKSLIRLDFGTYNESVGCILIGNFCTLILRRYKQNPV